MIFFMDGIATTGAAQSGDTAIDMVMLKKTQDLMKQQNNQLLAALPPPQQAPNPPGMGGHIDIRA